MKKTLLPLLLAVAILASPAAFASCPTAPTGPHTFGISTWYDYGPDEACWQDPNKISGALEEIEVECAGANGYRHGYGYTKTEYTFNVPSDPDDVLENWWVSFRIHFDDPNNSSFNWVRLKVYVKHNGVTTVTTLFNHNGGSGDLSCASSIENFNAVAGDEVRLLLETNNWYNDTVIETTYPQIENSWP